MEYIRFKDVISSTQYGYTADETSTVEGKYKYFRITDIVPYYIDYDRIPFCKIEEKNVEKYLLKEDDLIIARTGATTGYNYVVEKGTKDSVFASYLIRFNYDRNIFYPKYIKYVFKSKTYYNFVNNYIGGSAQPGMNARVLGRFLIPYFEYDKQVMIANALLQYDELIQNNTKRIKLLEKMAENLYKEWFVRFRFPWHEEVEFENGLPKGWESKKLSEVFEVKYGKDHKNIEDGDIPILGSGGVMRYGNKSLYSGESVLIPRKGSLNNVMYMNEDFWTVDTMFYTKLIIENIGKYAFYTLNNMDLASYNSGAALPSMTTDILYHLKIVVPTQNVLIKFNEIVDSLYKKKEQLLYINNNLIKQRDLLLPRLMSGKLEVK